MKILVINAGSSSLKFQLIDMDDESVKAKGLVERIGIEGTHFKQTVLGTDKVIEFTRNMKDHTEAISAVLSALTDKDNGGSLLWTRSAPAATACSTAARRSRTPCW